MEINEIPDINVTWNVFQCTKVKINNFFPQLSRKYAKYKSEISIALFKLGI